MALAPDNTDRLAADGGTSLGLPGVVDVLPLTPAQTGILFHSLARPGSDVYVEQVRCTLVGPFDVDDLVGAWHRLHRRHEALRTLIVWDGLDRPIQVIRDQVDPEITCRARTELAGQPDAVDQLAAADRAHGFDLERAPLSRLTVVADDLGLELIWTFHHLILDGWSTAALVGELIDDLSDGADRSSGDGRAGTSVRPYLEWIADRPADDAAFWERHLAGVTEPSLIGDRLAPPANPSPGRAVAGRTLSDGEAGRLRKAARSHHLTLNTVTQAAWARTLGQYLDADDVLFGVAVSTRPAEVAHASSMIGMLLNTVPQRVELGTSLTPAGLAAIQRSQLELADHGHASLADVQQRWAQRIDRSATALFDTLLVFENYPRREGTDSTVEVRDYRVRETTNYPITVLIGDSFAEDGSRQIEPGINFEILADAAVIDDRVLADLADRLAMELVRLAAALDDGTAPEHFAPGATTETPPAPPADPGGLLARFAATVAADPTAIAVSDGAGSITRGELDRRARMLATDLRRAEIEPGTPVALLVDRSIDELVAALGIVGAGACYVPLDLAQPVARLDALLRDAGIHFAVAGGGSGIELADQLDVVSIAVDAPAPEGSRRSEASGEPVTADTDLLWTFTSGSTGRPKAVPLTHGAVLSRIDWQDATMPGAENELVLAKTSPAFVDHLSEWWWPLCSGHEIRIVDGSTVRDAAALLDLVDDPRVRRLVVVPSLLETALDTVDEAERRLGSLVWLISSGEPLARNVADRLAEQPVELLNIYGMSEACADVTVHWVGSSAPGSSHRSRVPLGRPLPGFGVSIVDRRGRIVPRGVIGEIEVSGRSVSVGYRRGRQSASADGFGRRSGRRVYRTGDRGWLDHDGVLHGAGRSDDQVKIRGMRVGLGEIGAALTELPGVRAGLAMLVDPTVEAAHADPTLVAVVEGPDSLDPKRLREQLRAILPSHMVPSRVVVLSSLPRTAGGKPDRVAIQTEARATLASTLHDRPGLDADHGPSGAGQPDQITRSVVSLFGELLERPDIHPEVDFFDAGGHSLTALRLVARTKQTFGVEIPLADVLASPTPRALAANIARQLGTAHEPSTRFEHLVDVLPDPGDEPLLFCLHGAGGNVLNFRPLARALQGELRLIGVQARGIDGVGEPHDDMTDMVDTYVDAISVRQPTGLVRLAGYSGGGTIALAVAEGLRARGRELAPVALIDTYHNQVRPRPYGRSTHLRLLRERGPRYVWSKLIPRLDEGRKERSYRRLLSEARAAGEPLPVQIRERHVTSTLHRVIGHHEMQPYHGPVLLVAAENPDPGLAHVAADHDLGAILPDLQIETVPGDHQGLLVGDNARQVARAIAGTDELPGLERPTAATHVYRHRPGGLDERPLLTRHIEPGDSVLDIGTAATGRSALLLRSMGARVTSIEPNQQAIAEFADRGERGVDLAAADMTALPFADDAFDGALIGFHGFDYLTDRADRARAVADIARVLRPGAHLILNGYNTLGIVTTPRGLTDRSNLGRRLQFVRSGEWRSGRLIDGNGLELHHGTIRQIRAEVEALGQFTIVEVAGLEGRRRPAWLAALTEQEPYLVFRRVR